MALSTAQFRTQIDDISTLAFADLKRLLEALDGLNPIQLRDALRETMPELISPYLTASGELTAALYEELRLQAVGTPFFAKSSGEVIGDQMDALVGYGMKPVFRQSQSTVLSLLGGGVQRMIAGASRKTIDDNARRDVVSTSWARVARPDACEFCLLLAGRGAVYRSEAAAGLVIGRGVDPSETAGRRGGQGRGVRGRGSRGLADSYHDFCRCVSEPTFYSIGSFRNPRTGREEPALIPIRTD